MTENETDLIKTTYWDSLAILQQQKDLEKAEGRKKFLAEIEEQNQKRKNKRDKKIVNFYLEETFPDAFQELGAKELSEKEFPSILKRAKRHFRLQIAIVSAILSLISGGVITSLIFWQSLGFLLPPILILAGISGLLGGLILSDLVKILTRGVYWENLSKNRETASLGG